MDEMIVDCKIQAFKNKDSSLVRIKCGSQEITLPFGILKNLVAQVGHRLEKVDDNQDRPAH